MAVGFTALVNVLLLATFVYRQWIPDDAISIGYGASVTVWLIAWWQSRWERRANLADAAGEPIPESPASVKKRKEQDKLFREAQQRYLESDWLGAEQLLLRLLKADARDVEGRLMLVTLWRHQGRTQEALRQLDKLERLEAAQHWQQEIAAERKRLEADVMQLANQEAQRFNHEYIGTEHILLGLIKEGSGVAANVLKNLDVDLRKIRLGSREARAERPRHGHHGQAAPDAASQEGDRVLDGRGSSLESQLRGHRAHFAGLLREQEGVAAQVLMNLGLKLEDVREEVLNLLGHGLEGEERRRTWWSWRRRWRRTRKPQGRQEQDACPG